MLGNLGGVVEEAAARFQASFLAGREAAGWDLGITARMQDLQGDPATVRVRRMGRRLGLSTAWALRLALAKRKVALMSGARYAGIDDAGLHVVVDGKPRLIAADIIVICAGQEEVRGLYGDPIARGQPARLIGGAERAAELDAMRAIEPGARLAYAFGATAAA